MTLQLCLFLSPMGGVWAREFQVPRLLLKNWNKGSPGLQSGEGNLLESARCREAEAGWRAGAPQPLLLFGSSFQSPGGEGLGLLTRLSLLFDKLGLCKHLLTAHVCLLLTVRLTYREPHGERASLGVPRRDFFLIELVEVGKPIWNEDSTIPWAEQSLEMELSADHTCAVLSLRLSSRLGFFAVKGCSLELGAELNPYPLSCFCCCTTSEQMDRN